MHPDFIALGKLNELKRVHRFTANGDRKESVAEHTWGVLVLADWFMRTYDFNVDRNKVLDLIRYHDIPEIITGDIPNHPDYDRSHKEQLDKEGIEKLPTIIPPSAQFIERLCKEYDEQSSREAQLAKAIDKIEAQLHALDCREDWESFTVEFMHERARPYMEPFPQLLAFYDEFLAYLVEHEYLH